MQKKYAVAIAIYALTFGVAVSHAQEKKCEKPEEMMVEVFYKNLSDWHKVYESYKKYRGCDDGYIAEGYSDTVVRLLADKWAEFPELAALAKNDKAFMIWVLGHIDATTGGDDLAKIVANAKDMCPAGSEDLCSNVVANAEKALRELR